MHEISAAVSWHGRLMVLAWGVLLPLGVVTARFFKVTPKQNWPKQLDNKLWWHTHLTTQYSGLILAVVGIYLVFNENNHPSSTALAQWHHYMGWVVILLGVSQAVGGVLRGSKGGPTDKNMRGDHYDMTRRRKIFERLHKTMGYGCIFLACMVILMGLVLSDAPRWMLLCLIIWWVGLVIVYIQLQLAGRAFDTYQAIWGDDPLHPGNQLPSAGWRSARYTEISFDRHFNHSTHCISQFKTMMKNAFSNKG